MMVVRYGRTMRVLFYIFGLISFPYFLRPTLKYKIFSYMMDILLILVKVSALVYIYLIDPATRINFSDTKVMSYFHAFLKIITFWADIMMVAYLTFNFDKHLELYRNLDTVFVKDSTEQAEDSMIRERIYRRCFWEIFVKIIVGSGALFYTLVSNRSSSTTTLVLFFITSLNVMKQNMMFAYVKFFVLYIVARIKLFTQHGKLNDISRVYEDHFKFISEVHKLIYKINDLFGSILFASVVCGTVSSCYSLYALFHIGTTHTSRIIEDMAGYILWTLTFIFDFASIFIAFGSISESIEESFKNLIRHNSTDFSTEPCSFVSCV